MDRRFFLKTTSMATATATLLTLPKFAFAENSEIIEFQTEIGSNHGHELSLSIAQVVELMGQTNDGSVVELDIQGHSGHPHGLSLSQNQLIELLANKQLASESTVVAGHAHPIRITLSILK